MLKKTADRMEKLSPSGIRAVNEKALAMERNGENVIHFEIGRPDFDTPEYIKKAAYESISKGNVFYTSNFGKMELRREIANKLNKQNKIDYKAEEILVTAGLSEAVMAVLVSILNPGDEILIPDPVWINYLNVPKLLGAKPIAYELKEENRFEMDLNEIESKISSRTKAIVIVSPNNPTGGVLSRRTLQELSHIIIRNDLFVISDEIYERLIYKGAEHISIASLPDMKQRTFTMNGMSKAFSMTGWRLGYVAAPEQYINILNKFHQHNTTCAASFVQDAAIVALRDEKNEVDDMVKEYQRRRDYVFKAINSIDGLSCLMPQGAFYFFINIKKLGIKSAVFTDYLLENAKIAMVPGNVFGDHGEGFVRMSFSNSYENIVEGCNRLKIAVENM